MFSMYSGNIKLSIGGRDDYVDWDNNFEPVLTGYVEPGRAGVGIEILNAEYLKYAYFGLAWVTLTSDDYETSDYTRNAAWL